MSSSTTAVNTFNKSKEDFIWFVKKAVQDEKSYSHSELYHSLLKLFVDADTNKDGLVSKASFSKLIDAAATMPRAYGYAPADEELYKTDAEKDAARQKMFDSMDLKSTGVITFDEWLKFCREHIAAKTATMDPHPIIDQGSVDEYKKFIKVRPLDLKKPLLLIAPIIMDLIFNMRLFLNPLICNFRLLLTIRAVLRPWSCTGTCWRSSLIMMLTRTVSSRWQSSHP